MFAWAGVLLLGTVNAASCPFTTPLSTTSRGTPSAVMNTGQGTHKAVTSTGQGTHKAEGRKVGAKWQLFEKAGSPG